MLVTAVPMREQLEKKKKKNIGLVQEKDVTLGIALKLRQNARKIKITKLFTLKIDEYHPLADRTDLAIRSHADLFISVTL